MNAGIEEVLRAVIGLVFAWSACTKLVSPVAFVNGVRRYEILPSSMSTAFAGCLISAEVVVATTHLSGHLLVIGIPLGLLLLSAFGIAVATNLIRQRFVPCACFAGEGEVISARVLSRLGSLAVAEGALLAFAVAPTGVGNWVMGSPQGNVSMEAVGVAALFIQVTLWVLSWREIVTLARRLTAT